MSRIGTFGQPGVQAAQFTQTNEIFWGGDATKIEILQANSQIDSSAVDAGSTPTNVLRTGLLFGKITSSGFLKQWDSAATDGSQYLFSVNREELVMVDAYGVAANRFAPTVVKAPLKAKRLYIKGVSLLGHADEYLARRQLAGLGVVLDDDVQNYLSGINLRNIIKTATGAILATENGARFIVNGAGAVILTLPTLQAGLRFEFLNIADQNLTVTSAAGDDVIIINDLSADSVAFSTAANKIGARLTVHSEYVNGTLKWITNYALATPTTAT